MQESIPKAKRSGSAVLSGMSPSDQFLLQQADTALSLHEVRRRYAVGLRELPLQKQVFLAGWKRTNAVHVESANYRELAGFLEAYCNTRQQSRDPVLAFPNISHGSPVYEKLLSSNAKQSSKNAASPSPEPAFSADID